MTDSDASLIARVIADDDHCAFELLVRRHQSQLRNFLRRLTRNEMESADDLAQETFIKAYRSVRSYRGSASFRSWLFRIAYNTFLNDQCNRFPEVEFDEAQHSSIVLNNENPGIELDIDRALEHLSVRQQAIFDLHYKKGMTHHEIAGALEAPLGTVKSDLRRGLDKLTQYLRDWKRG